MSCPTAGRVWLSLLERLSYQPAVVQMARRLPGRRLLSKLYYHWCRPSGDLLRIELGGVECGFELRAHWQLRWLKGLAVMPALDPDLKTLLANIRPGDVVYDIGANMGVFTVPLAKLAGAGGTVVAFEPQKAVFDHLQANARLNGLENVRLYRKGLGDRDTTASIQPAHENVLSRLVASNGTRKGQHGIETVDIVNGDRFRSCENLPFPNAVKIDVEGYEDAVIVGLQTTLARPECRLLCCEIHPPLLPHGASEASIHARLRGLGFDRISVHSFDTWSVAVCHKP